MFERFWQIHPRKVGRKAALKAWMKLNPNHVFGEKIIAALQAQVRWREHVERKNATLPRWERKFVPEWKHPVTWINQGCWDDEVPELDTPKPEVKKTACLDCGQPYTHRFNGQPYCLKHYDRRAHPELFANDRR